MLNINFFGACFCLILWIKMLNSLSLYCKYSRMSEEEKVKKHEDKFNIYKHQENVALQNAVFTFAMIMTIIMIFKCFNYV